MENKEPIQVDYDKCFDYIVNETGVDKEIVIKVIDSETNYLASVGVIETDQNPTSN